MPSLIREIELSLAEVVPRKREKCEVARTLYFPSEFTLALGTESCLPSRSNFTRFTDMTTQYFHVFVVYIITIAGILGGTEKPASILEVAIRHFSILL